MEEKYRTTNFIKYLVKCFFKLFQSNFSDTKYTKIDTTFLEIYKFHQPTINTNACIMPISKHIEMLSNQCILSSGNKGAFDKKITALSAVTPYQNGIAFQFGDQQYPLETSEPEYVYEILARIVNSTEDI